ncbi:TIGR04104 family putative zinc finger protein [Oceanobacillus sp. 1P07AA]|uniref:TIGR04104 family putative zinc finger protein n=1 Tax=Oceanobacillus sp. 1P07AA TaxID=3132293 RepID=UPI0039A5BA46
MKLPRCWNCKHQFAWKDLCLRIKPCPSCEKSQYLTKESRNNAFLFTPICSIFIVVMLSINVNNSITACISAIILFVIYSLLPFIYQFTNKEQPFI